MVLKPEIAAARPVEPADDVEESRFAGAGRAGLDDERAGAGLDAYAVSRIHLHVARPLHIGECMSSEVERRRGLGVHKCLEAAVYNVDQ